MTADQISRWTRSILIVQFFWGMLLGTLVFTFSGDQNISINVVLIILIGILPLEFLKYLLESDFAQRMAGWLSGLERAHASHAEVLFTLTRMAPLVENGHEMISHYFANADKDLATHEARGHPLTIVAPALAEKLDLIVVQLREMHRLHEHAIREVESSTAASLLRVDQLTTRLHDYAAEIASMVSHLQQHTTEEAPSLESGYAYEVEFSSSGYDELTRAREEDSIVHIQKRRPESYINED